MYPPSGSALFCVLFFGLASSTQHSFSGMSSCRWADSETIHALFLLSRVCPVAEPLSFSFYWVVSSLGCDNKASTHVCMDTSHLWDD